MSGNHTSILYSLQTRQAEIADRWYHAVARTGFIGQKTATVPQSFHMLTEQIIELLFAEPMNRQQAHAIGSALSRLTYGRLEALRSTNDVLGQELVAELPNGYTSIVLTRLVPLLGEIAIGFTHQVRETVLAEQEQMYAALIDQWEQMAAALQDSEHRLRMMLTNAPIVLFVIDCNCVFTLAEGQGLKTLGLTAENVIGQSILTMKDTAPQIVENIQRALTGDEFTDIVEIEMLTFKTCYAPLRDQQEQVIGVMGVALDITEHRRLQEKLEAIRNYSTHAAVLPLSEDLAMKLSRREWDVVQLILAGKSNREIALTLSISIKTVEKHINRVYSKLGVDTRVAVTRWALGATWVMK